MGMRAIQDRDPRTLRYVLIGAVALVLLCVVGLLVYNILTSEPGDVAAVDTPTPTVEAGAGEETAPTAEEEAATPTPTRVIGDESAESLAEVTAEAETAEESDEEPTGESGEEPTEEPPATPTTPTPQPNGTNQGTAPTTITVVEEEVAIDNVVQNGGFEQGFDDRGVGLGWDTFKNDSINVFYGPESLAYVRDGSEAQRITTVGASQGNRYTGIYQQFDVVPGEPYTLEMHGQIRSPFGNVEASSYGYRMQYAVAQRAMRNWEMVPDEAWVELPWDEQPLDSPAAEFSEYTTEIVPTSERITLFIRTWNKWADVGEAHFTLDDISLTGPTMVTETIVVAAANESVSGETASTTGSDTTDEEQMVNGGLPVTGVGESGSLSGDGRFWGAVVVLCLLGLGAVYRAKWTH